MDNHAESQPKHPPLELLAHGFDNSGPASSGPAETPTDMGDGDNHSAEGPSRKASYALALQKACDTALKRVKSNNIIVNSNWVSPLAAAPSAISTMAILFKVADKECAAGLEVESQEVMDAENNVVKGRLP
jgi:hypothetical protein